MTALRVLIVEDARILVTMWNQAVEMAADGSDELIAPGSVVATSVDQALLAIRDLDAPIDVILTDWHLRGVDAGPLLDAAILERAGAGLPEIPVLVFSGGAGADVVAAHVSMWSQRHQAMVGWAQKSRMTPEQALLASHALVVANSPGVGGVHDIGGVGG